MTEPWRFTLCDDLEKVRPHLDPRPWAPDLPLTGFLGERLGIQLAVGTPAGYAWWPPVSVRVEVACPGAEIATHRVDLVPVQLPAFPGHDENYLEDVPSLLPDVLVPLGGGEPVPLGWLGWSSVWIDLTPVAANAGPLTVRAVVDEEVVFEQQVALEVTPVEAPASRLTHLAWLHADGLAHHHDTPVWSELHWTAIANHVTAAVQMGVTAILTPVWTPPLDTAVGHTRLPVQLLGIGWDDEGYHFDTTRLDRYLAVLTDAGARQVEVPHLFTQWGATATPQVWVDSAEGPEQRFGWHVGALDESYRQFLTELIPFLREHLESSWGVENVIWHVSDEPQPEQLASYTAARASVAGLLEGAVVVDALSSPEFVGVVDHPVVATDHVHGFVSRGLPAPMVYYCISQNRAVSNRFIAQHAVGARHLAGQLFAQRATGFLHWGFNFYLTQFGLAPLDPFRDTSAGGRFLSGDAFIVYPGPEGACWPSLRHRVLAEMTCDLRVMHWAQDLVGRDAVLAVVDPDGQYAGDRGYEAPWPDPEDWRRRRLALDRLVRAALVEQEPVR